MKTREALTVLAPHRGDAIVVCALGMAANEWWAVTKSEDSFYMHGGMGFAASFALGPRDRAAARAGMGAQQRRLAVDESRLPAHRGRPAAGKPQAFRGRQPELPDRRHHADGEPGQRRLRRRSPKAPASARSRPSTISPTSRRACRAIVAAPGPYFIRLRVESEPDYQRAPPATYEGPEMKYRFGRALEKKLGIKVFGPRGF